MTGWGRWADLTLGYHLLSRMAYVIVVGVALTMQTRRRVFTRHAGTEAGYRRFRRIAATLMNNDGVSFVVLCVVTRNTFHLSFPPVITIGAGALLVVIGVSIKVWAAVRLGPLAYYWYDFFALGSTPAPNPPGPYRFLKNPMYTLGYLQTYGLALAFGSMPALLASIFAQTAILVFHYSVEKPHFDLLPLRAAGATPGVLTTKSE